MIKENPLSYNSEYSKECENKPQIQEIEKLNLKELSNNLPNDKRKNKSLFAQNLERKGKLKSFLNLNQNELSNTKNASPKLNLKPSSIISCEGLGNPKEKEQIHKENMEKLASMASDEILREQQKLVQQLDPKILAFIRQKNANQANQNSFFESTAEKLTLDKEEILNDMPIKPNKKWLNMDKIEYEKLEWMIKPKNPIKKSDSNESAAARFDFEGNLISPDEEVPVTRALHHHGK